MKGDMPIQTVGKIVLVLLVVALVFSVFNGWFQQMVGDFIGGIQFPTM